MIDDGPTVRRPEDVADGRTLTVAAADPRCGRCGYNVRASRDGGVCPECGADLAVVGTFTGARRPTVARRWVRVAAWSLAVFVAVSLCYLNRARLPLPREVHVRRYIFLNGNAAGRGLAGIVSAEAIGYTFGPAPIGGGVTLPVTDVTLHWEGSKTEADLRVCWPAGAVHDAGRGVTTATPSGFGPSAVSAWATARSAARGDDVSRLSPVAVADQSTDVATAVRQMVAGTGRGFLFFATGASDGVAQPAAMRTDPPAWFQATVTLIALAGWLGGCRYLWRRPIG